MQWCLGMYSSGSTWVVHALRSVGDVLFPGTTHVMAFVETANDLPQGWSRSGRLFIKTHATDDTAATLLSRGADHIWISIRDPRDCVASVMTHMHKTFDAALESVARSAEHCGRFVSAEKSTLLRYEDGFTDDPATLDFFAGGFSRTLWPLERDRVFQQTRRTAIETMIQTFEPGHTVDDGTPGHRVHLATQWHTHHMNRTGEIGRWRRTLDEAQAAEVTYRMGSWMNRFGYRT